MTKNEEVAKYKEIQDSEQEREWRGAWSFVLGADTQFGFMADPTWGAEGDGSTWNEEIHLAERFVRCCNAFRPEPRFVCMCGDLVHSLPEGVLTDSPAVRRYANESRYQQQNADFKRVMSGLKMPLVCVCGNHDVGDVPTAGSLAAYRQLYGADWRAFWCGGVRNLVLNAQLFSNPRDSPDQAAAQEKWLAQELEALVQDKAKHAIVFQHIPWFLRDENEPREGYFNLPPELRQKWLPLMEKAGVKGVFGGHYHRNLCARTRSGGIEMVITSAVGRQMSESEVAGNAPDPPHGGLPGTTSDTRSGLRLVKVGEAGLAHEYHEFDTLEKDLGVGAQKVGDAIEEVTDSTEAPQKRSRVGDVDK